MKKHWKETSEELLAWMECQTHPTEWLCLPTREGGIVQVRPIYLVSFELDPPETEDPYITTSWMDGTKRTFALRDFLIAVAESRLEVLESSGRAKPEAIEDTKHWLELLDPDHEEEPTPRPPVV